MPLVNHIEPYVPGTIPFSQYLEQMEWVFIDNKMADANEQKASFLAACGKEVYSELKLLFPGKDLKTVSFKEITDSLKKRYDKTESDMIQRFKFYQRVQGPTESAEDFILAVKLQAELCEFGEFKDIAIRDKLVCGIRDPDVQQRLFDEEALTLAKAEKIIINRELAGANRKLVSRESDRVSVGGRIYSAHRNQLKLVGTPKRRGLFLGRSERNQRRKRTREDDDDDDRFSDDDEEDFYGFPSDSFIYSDGGGRNGVASRSPEAEVGVPRRRSASHVEEDLRRSSSLPAEQVEPQTGPSHRAVCQSSPSKNRQESVRRSKRPKRLKKDFDYEYY
ncbi:AAEL001117-PA [Aedes aegypti]|uniref:AAEL001117-PA n=1 Tax=Aedes aegypti TaxID=7159 RepID=Q17M66_AEDAE|nr:AAEL001117-PA [Aedes aegypti]